MSPAAALLSATDNQNQETDSVDAVDALTRRLVSDLHSPRPAIFWTDVLASAACGWSAFAIAVAAAPFSSLMLAASIVSALALYRGLCFTHEITHLRRASIPGFETAWNVLFGVPLLLPSFTYLGVHQNHHNLSTYGTNDDPEYLPFAHSRSLVGVFALQSVLLTPALLLIRFLVMAPIGLASSRFHQWLECHASSFAMNPRYRRSVSGTTADKMRRWEVAILAAWGVALWMALSSLVPPSTFLIWYTVVVCVSALNTSRVLGAHAYETDGAARDRLGQLRDSIDTPGGPWTELWAPVGLRYHALHHYFPGIPYHNLGVAYRRIVNGLPPDSVYEESTSPGLRHSLTSLLTRRG